MDSQDQEENLETQKSMESPTSPIDFLVGPFIQGSNEKSFGIYSIKQSRLSWKIWLRQLQNRT